MIFMTNKKNSPSVGEWMLTPRACPLSGFRRRRRGEFVPRAVALFDRPEVVQGALAQSQGWARP